MWYKWSGGEVYIGFWWGNLREIEHFDDLGINGRVILKLIIRKLDGRMCVIYLV